MDGWLHCLITNCPEQTIQNVQDWVLYQTSLCSGGSRDHSNGSEGDISFRHRLIRNSLSAEDSLGVVSVDEGDSVDGRGGLSDSLAYLDRAFNGGDEGKLGVHGGVTKDTKAYLIR